MTDNRITHEELKEMFGEMMPIEAANLLFGAPDTMTIGEVRAELRAIAARKNVPPMTLDTALAILVDIHWGGPECSRWSPDDCVHAWDAVRSAVKAPGSIVVVISAAEPTDAGMARIYLMCQRKSWHYPAIPDGWRQVAWERFSYVECAIYEKPTADLTDDDRENWVAHYSEEPEGWIEPHGFG